MDPINFECVKVTLRQNKDGFMLTLAIHPDDLHQDLVRDFVGARYAVAMVRIGDDEQPYVRPKISSFVQTAGILAKDPEFQRFCVETGWCFAHSEDEAARAICEILNIESRSELVSNTEAQGGLIDLRKEFDEWKRNTNES